MKAFLDRAFSLEEINGNGVCPTYLYRWTLLSFRDRFSVYLHKFVGDDWSIDKHDHPKRFISIGLWGSYTEWTPGSRDREVCIRWNAPWIRSFPASHIHRLTGPTPSRPCWTLVIVGRPVKPWGFWQIRPGFRTFIPWRMYVQHPDRSERRSCP